MIGYAFLILNILHETVQHNSIHLFFHNNKISQIILLFILITTQSSFAQQNKIDSIKEIVINCKSDTSYINLQNKLSYLYKESRIYDTADSIAHEALSKAKLIKYQFGILRSNLNLAEIQYELLNYSGSLEIYQNLAQLSSEYNNKKYLAICYHRIAMILEDQAKLDESLKYNLKALEIRKALNDQLGISYSLSSIASYYMYKSDFNKTLEYYFEAITVYNELKDTKSIAYTYYNIGKVYFNIYNYTEAIKYYNLCREMTSKLNDLRATAITIRSIGEVYYHLGNDEEAIRNFNESLEIAIKIKDEITVASSYVGIGTVLQKQRKFQEALQLFQKALISFETIDYKIGIVVASLNIGETNIRLGKLKAAKKIINRGLALNKELGGFKEYYKGGYYNLFEIDSIQNNWKSALTYFKLYNSYKDSLLEEANSKTKDSLKIAFEYANRASIEKSNNDKETSLLVQNGKNEKNIFISVLLSAMLISFMGFKNLKNKRLKEQAVLNQKAAELKRQIDENALKVLHSQMNPHFIFNCVDSIERLLDNEKIEESKLCLVNFSNLTRTVLENSKKKEIALSEEIKVLCLYMDLENMRFKNNFTYNILIEPGIEPETTLIPPLIMQPFVENSIKHGFRDSEKLGHLNIEVRKENELLVCMVEDNGLGRLASSSIRSVSGFKKESFGMKLTAERLEMISEIKKIKSHFLIDDLVDLSNKPTGTRVKIFLPYELSV